MIAFSIYKKLSAATGDMQLQIDTSIESGKLVTLYGKSGAGKTSILRMLAGLFQADEGFISVDGNKWLDSKNNINLSPQKRKVGFVFQDYALFPNMTVRENLTFALEKGQNQKVIEELIDIIELEGLQNRKPSTLSGGQKQRVALARALVQKPKLLLLDEPLSALDLEMRNKLQQYILKLHKRYNLTTILISHDLDEISKMSDEILLIEQGKLVKRGTVAEVFPSSSMQFSGKLVEIEAEEQNCKLVVLINEEWVDLFVDERVAEGLVVGDEVVVESRLVGLRRR